MKRNKLNKYQPPHWLHCKCLFCGKFVPKDKINDLEYICECIKILNEFS